MKARTLHFTVNQTGDLFNSRACGAKLTQWGTIKPAEVTCKACLRTKIWKLSVRSWKPEFQVDGVWYDNAVRFATYPEAHLNASAKYMVWTVPTAYRVSASEDPPNYWTGNGHDLEPLERPEYRGKLGTEASA